MSDNYGPISKLARYLLRRRKSQEAIHAFFITGTDTGIGKTSITCALLSEFRRQNIPAAGFKPICCGDREDAKKFWRLSDKKIPLHVINPVHLSRPLAPIAQRSPHWNVMIRRIHRALRQYPKFGIQILLVEGVGGLFCPVDRKRTMRELARAMRLPLVIVARNQLGVLNHVLLTVEVTRSKRQTCAAIVLTSARKRASSYSDHSRSTNAAMLKRIIKIPIFEF